MANSRMRRTRDSMPWGSVRIDHTMSPMESTSSRASVAILSSGGRAIGADARYFTQDGNLRQAGADVIVQVSGDGGSHAFQIQHLGQAIAMSRENQSDPERHGHAFKPPASPQRWQHGEIDLGWNRAFQTIGSDGLYEKTVFSPA